MARHIKCTITMILIEGKHFATGIPAEDELSDEEALEEATFRFQEILGVMDPEDVIEYIQARFTDEAS